MDADTLKRKLDAARRFVHSDEAAAPGVSLTLSIPTELLMRSCVARLPQSERQSRLALLQEALMLASIVDWSGIRECDLMPGGAETPLAFDDALLPDVIDRFAALYDSAYIALMHSFNERKSRFEAELKN